MGFGSFEAEIPCTVPATRMFKAVALDFTKLLPKVMPQVITGADFLEGDGGVGSIRQIQYNIKGESSMFLKERIDSIDEEKLAQSYTAIEGSTLEGRFEKIINEMKVEASPDGEGSIIKYKTSYYYIKGGNEMSEEALNAAKEQSIGLYKAIEAYLLANPEEDA
ncbi:Major pollen allergen Bet v 1-A [Euphorbia peplus]|nr:Major pollen allergen Bet v 1-A [Euphorbia peplus]